MTVATLIDSPQTFVSIVSWDRGVSKAAKRLRDQLAEARQAGPSIALGARQRALDEVRSQAAAPDWDGDGGLPVSIEAYSSAVEFSQSLPTSVSPPDIWPSPYGDVVFEWNSDSRWLFAIAIDGEGMLNYSGIFRENTAYGKESFVDEIPEVVRTQLLRYFSGAAEGPESR